MRLISTKVLSDWRSLVQTAQQRGSSARLDALQTKQLHLGSLPSRWVQRWPKCWCHSPAAAGFGVAAVGARVQSEEMLPQMIDPKPFLLHEMCFYIQVLLHQVFARSVSVWIGSRSLAVWAAPGPTSSAAWGVGRCQGKGSWRNFPGRGDDSKCVCRACLCSATGWGDACLGHSCGRCSCPWQEFGTTWTLRFTSKLNHSMILWCDSVCWCFPTGYSPQEQTHRVGENQQEISTAQLWNKWT